MGPSGDDSNCARAFPGETFCAPEDETLIRANGKIHTMGGRGIVARDLTNRHGRFTVVGIGCSPSPAAGSCTTQGGVT